MSAPAFAPCHDARFSLAQDMPPAVDQMPPPPSSHPTRRAAQRALPEAKRRRFRAAQRAHQRAVSASRALAGPDSGDAEARRALRVVSSLDFGSAGSLAESAVLPALRELLGDLVRDKALKLGPISAACKRDVPADAFGRHDRMHFVRWWLRSQWAALVRERTNATAAAMSTVASGAPSPRTARAEYDDGVGVWGRG